MPEAIQSGPAVLTRGLTRKFGQLVAVDSLDLEVHQGEIFGIVGPDGAGKTTTLRLLCGLLDPTAGSATVAGFDAHSSVADVKDRIGYMAQRFGLYSDLTVDENMAFYGDLFGVSRSTRRELAGSLLHMTRMEPFRKRAAGKLSGGMKQKLALMCTLLHRPQILLLDEPTNGVDPVSRRDFWAILYQLVKDGMTVVVSTAYLDEAERCNRVGLMHRGRLIRCDTPESLKSGLDEQCFSVEAPDLRRARLLLENAPGVLSVEPAGSALHMFVDQAENSAGALLAHLDAEGAGPAQAEPIQPSLEDVFIALIRKAGLPAHAGEAKHG